MHTYEHLCVRMKEGEPGICSKNTLEIDESITIFWGKTQQLFNTGSSW